MCTQHKLQLSFAAHRQHAGVHSPFKTQKSLPLFSLFVRMHHWFHQLPDQISSSEARQRYQSLMKMGITQTHPFNAAFASSSSSSSQPTTNRSTTKLPSTPSTTDYEFDSHGWRFFRLMVRILWVLGLLIVVVLFAILLMGLMIGALELYSYLRTQLNDTLA